MHWTLLHDPGMFGSHLLSLTGRFLVSWLILDWRFYWAVFTGLGQLPAIMRKRKATRQSMQTTDRMLRDLLEKFYREAPITLRQAGRP